MKKIIITAAIAIAVTIIAAVSPGDDNEFAGTYSEQQLNKMALEERNFLECREEMVKRHLDDGHCWDYRQ